VQSARPIDEYLVLMTASKATTNVLYHRPSYLVDHRLFLVHAGHGGTNNCLVHSIITGIVMHAKVLDIGLPVFLKELRHVSWSTIGSWATGTWSDIDSGVLGWLLYQVKQGKDGVRQHSVIMLDPLGHTQDTLYHAVPDLWDTETHS
jgi:hypothetical protein